MKPTAHVLLLFLSLSCPAAAAAGSDAAAVVNGRAIAADDVDAPIAGKLHALEQQLFALRRSSLENLIARRVLEDAAKRRGITIEELKRELARGEVVVSDAEVEAQYTANALTFAGTSGDEARQRIRLDLETGARMRLYRDAVRKLVDAADVERLLAAPRLRTASASGGPVSVTVFSDFECTFCRSMKSALQTIRARYGDRVAVTHRNLPLENHPNAFAAARAAVCAGRQGRFWEFHDALFDAPAVSDAAIRAAAAKAGADLGELAVCVADEASALAVHADREAARRLAIEATPTLLVNGRVLRGALGVEELDEAIRSELLLANAKPETKERP